jgi:hypothetical protein
MDARPAWPTVTTFRRSTRYSDANQSLFSNPNLIARKKNAALWFWQQICNARGQHLAMAGQDSSTHVLIVEPDRSVSQRLQRACGSACVTSSGDFSGGRARMLSAAPDLLVTNLRLNEYNGLHLILLSHAERARLRCIVHTNRPDFLLIKEAQNLGAFFERTERLPYALPSYIRNRWPPKDNRDPRRFDRRRMFRGGRRGSDLEELAALS